jgi:hypothetical protein
MEECSSSVAGLQRTNCRPAAILRSQDSKGARMRSQFMCAAAMAVLLMAGPASAADKPEFGEVGLDLASMDKTVAPGDDFYAYVNGGWLKSATIPADRSNYSDVARLREQSLARVRGIVEAGAASPSSADARKFGDRPSRRPGSHLSRLTWR